MTKPDKVGNNMQRDLFVSLRLVYRRLGSRLEKLRVVGGHVQWQKEGHFAIEGELGQDGLKFRLKRTGDIALIPSALICADPGPFSIAANYSTNLATLTTPRLEQNDDGLLLRSWFPSLRTLKRRESEEVGAVAPLGGDEDEEDCGDEPDDDDEAQDDSSNAGADGEVNEPSPPLPPKKRVTGKRGASAKAKSASAPSRVAGKAAANVVIGEGVPPIS